MRGNRIRVALLFGGQSCEHEVSVTSARSVLAAIDRDKYDVTLVGISKTGQWLLESPQRRLLDGGSVTAAEEGDSAILDYAGGGRLLASASTAGGPAAAEFDVVFPLLHGPHGEDGTVQGLLELANIAYVGSGVVGSAVGMDKEMARRVFAAEGLRQTDYVTVRRSRWRREPDRILDAIEERLQFPMFAKPVSLGSSVGISKAHDRDGLRIGLETAARFDYKIMIEQSVEDCHEVEVAVLGNEEPQASAVGEIVPNAEFYDYRTKYIDDRSELLIPARISDAAAAEVRAMALAAFRAVEAWGLARVDFFVRRSDATVFINEINTMPGFTPISMFPRLWQASGIDYPRLIDRLIELALERHRDRQDVQNAL